MAVGQVDSLAVQGQRIYWMDADLYRSDAGDRLCDIYLVRMACIRLLLPSTILAQPLRDRQFLQRLVHLHITVAIQYACSAESPRNSAHNSQQNLELA